MDLGPEVAEAQTALFPAEESGIESAVRISGNILNGDVLSPIPLFHKILDQNAETVTTWIVEKSLVLKFGEGGAKPLLESELTRMVAKLASDKTQDFASAWMGGPLKQFLQGQLTQSELEQKSRELVTQIYAP